MVESAVREETKRPAAKAADLYSWARRQAELLRAGRLSEIDAAAIAEEIDDVGEEQYDKLESAFASSCSICSSGTISPPCEAARGP
jgi:hypothetical protein